MIFRYTFRDALGLEFLGPALDNTGLILSVLTFVPMKLGLFQNLLL